MDVKKVALLVGALVIAVITAVMAKNMFAETAAPPAQATPAPVPVGPEVLVATRSLPVGSIIDPTAFRYQLWPAELVDKTSYFVKGGAAADPQTPPVDPATLVGSVVRTEINAGQPVTNGSLIKPGDRGFLSAALGPGMRAVTVPIGAISGVAGFIFPGDRVDIMLIQEVKGIENQALKAAETIVRNVRVLAIDQRVHQKNEHGHPIVAVGRNVTLEVTPRLAEKIQVAQTIGSLTLALRSLTDTSEELERAIATGEVKVPEGTNPADERKMMLQVAAQPIDAFSTYSTGADVSRFQRRSVPKLEDDKPVIAIQGPTVNVSRAGNIQEVQLPAPNSGAK